MNKHVYAVSEELRWRELDGEWVVFMTTPATVCCLDPLSAAVLGVIETEPATAESVVDTLSGATAIPVDAAFQVQIGAALERLVASHLIEARAG